MILKNLVVSTCLLTVLGSFVFADDASVPGGNPGTNTGAVPTTLLNTPSEPTSAGGMDPEVRRLYLSTITPSVQPVLADNGGFLVSSVESYDVSDETVRSRSCSFVARKNLVALLGTFHTPDVWIAQGDANDLIRFGELNHTLTSFSKTSLIDALSARKVDFFETVFDVYRRVPTRSYAMQGHRVTVFLGDDDQWYILDPLDGEKTTKPQLLSTYLEHDVDNAEWFTRFPGYSRMHPLDASYLTAILPFFSSELQLFFQPHSLIVENKGTTIAEQSNKTSILTISEMSA